jgi:hypothetical protein
MIKFSEVKSGQIFTFSFYDKRDCPIENGFVWVFVKIDDCNFITIHCFAKSNIGKVYTYDKNDDSPCLLLTATFDDFY